MKKLTKNVYVFIYTRVALAVLLIIGPFLLTYFLLYGGRIYKQYHVYITQFKS